MSNPNNPGIPEDDWQWYAETGAIGEEAVSPEEHAYPEAPRTVETPSDYDEIAKCLLSVVARNDTRMPGAEVITAVHKATGFTEAAVGTVLWSFAEKGLVTPEAEGLVLTEDGQALHQDVDEPRSD